MKDVLDLLKMVHLILSSMMKYTITTLVMVCMAKWGASILEYVSEMLVMVYMLYK